MRFDESTGPGADRDPASTVALAPHSMHGRDSAGSTPRSAWVLRSGGNCDRHARAVGTSPSRGVADVQRTGSDVPLRPASANAASRPLAERRAAARVRPRDRGRSRSARGRFAFVVRERTARSGGPLSPRRACRRVEALLAERRPAGAWSLRERPSTGEVVLLRFEGRGGPAAHRRVPLRQGRLPEWRDVARGLLPRRRAAGRMDLLLARRIRAVPR